MTKSILLSCAVACSLAALAPLSVIAEPASGMDRYDTKVVVQDSAITSSVKAALTADHVEGLRHVRVDTDNHGVVTLKGHTRTQDAADRAIAIARNTDGVREVHSAIKIEKDD